VERVHGHPNLGVEEEDKRELSVRRSDRVCTDIHPRVWRWSQDRKIASSRLQRLIEGGWLETGNILPASCSFAYTI
jgi:hypothetical protein